MLQHAVYEAKNKIIKVTFMRPAAVNVYASDWHPLNLDAAP